MKQFVCLNSTKHFEPALNFRQKIIFYKPLAPLQGYLRVSKPINASGHRICQTNYQ